VFNHSIARTWALVKDFNEVTKMFPDISEIAFLKGSNSYEIGNIFTFKMKKICNTTFNVEKVIDEEDNKLIMYRCVKSHPSNLKYTNTYHLYKDTIESNTLLLWEINYDEDSLISIEELENANVIRMNMLKKYDEYLNSSFEEISQTETVVLNIKRTCLWAIVANCTNFKKVVPFIADEVVYEGDPNNVNTKLILKWIKKKVECYLKVTKVNCDKKSDIWEYHMNCYKGVPVVPNQEIKFKIVKINEDSCFLEFKHMFRQYIKQDILDTIAKDKKKDIINVEGKADEINKFNEKIALLKHD